jgi:hypothetical protein
VPLTQAAGPIRLTVDYDSGPLAGVLSVTKDLVVAAE